MINFRLVRHLWLFLAVAEEQNFGRAAKRLGMSQPPLTEQIQVLEQALKVKLFERSRRGAQLTHVGRAILPAVRKFVDQLEHLEVAVREAVSGQSGTLTIGAISSALLEVVPPLLERLRAQRPDLSVSVREIDSAEALPALHAGDIDLAFARLQPEGHDTIETLPMARDRLAVALPSSHPMAARRNVKLASLADEVFVMFERRLSPVYFDSIVAACQAQGFSPRILREVRSVTTQVAFVGCNQGIALVPSDMRALAPANVTLRPLVERIDTVATAAAWNTTRMTPALQVAVDVIRAAPIRAGRAPVARRRSPPAS
jgi:DNA-binding transcriptional LysR family regulator